MTNMSDYSPPKVWTWDKASGGQFANINRPIAGATHDKELPVGKHPLQLYSLATPNGVKVTIMLEELLALGHSGRRIRCLADPDRRGRPVRQRIRRGQSELEDPGADGPQRRHAGTRVRIRRDPALSGGEIRRLPADGAARRARSACPGCSGRWAARPISAAASAISMPMRRRRCEYPIDRFAMEVKRQLDVLDRRLADKRVFRRRRLYDRRYGGLALVWRAGEGLELRLGRIPFGA